jgi:Ion channel
MPSMNSNIKTYFASLRERWRDPMLTSLTVLLALLLFVLAPLQATGAIRSDEFSLALLAVGTAALFVVSGNPLTVVAVLIYVCLSAAAAIMRLRGSPNSLYLEATGWIILGICVGWSVTPAVFGPGRVNYHRIVGAILLYLTVGATFVAFYTFVGLMVPGAFSGVSFDDNPALPSNLIYFSFVTLTSTGYGDIVPVRPIARSLANIEGIIGQLYPATLLARLVSLEIASRHRG